MSNTRRAPVIITLATALLFLALAAAATGAFTPQTTGTARAATLADEFERFFGFRMEISPGPPSERVWRGSQGGGVTVIPMETAR